MYLTFGIQDVRRERKINVGGEGVGGRNLHGLASQGAPNPPILPVIEYQKELNKIHGTRRT